LEVQTVEAVVGRIAAALKGVAPAAEAAVVVAAVATVAAAAAAAAEFAAVETGAGQPVVSVAWWREAMRVELRAT
jgi:hypothetical protein